MRILYFGAYNATDQRNAIIREGLRQNGVELVDCQDSSGGLKKFVKLFIKHWEIRKDYDVIFVGFLSHILMPLVYVINSPLISGRPRKPVVLDGYMSLYDSNVFGRQKYKPNSFWAYYYWLIDWIAFSLGDVVLFDTNGHIEYIAKEFGIRREKMARLFVGARENIFYPRPEEAHTGFNVFFHGSFIPSQGIEFILQAAKNLEGHKDISFTILGDGQVKEKMLGVAKQLDVKNVTFLGRMPPQELVSHVPSADLCLGLFGKADKIQRVIATKVFEYAAMKKAIITGEAPAMRGIFTDEDVVFVRIADPDDITRAILRLKENPELIPRLAENAHRKFQQYASTSKIGEELKKIISKLIAKDR